MTIKGSMSTWDLLKKVADPQELKELKAIEDRHKKKPNSLNSFGKKLMKQNPLDKIPGELIKNIELYDDPKPEVIRDLKKWEQGNKPDNSDPIVANGVITTEKQLLKNQYIDRVKPTAPLQKKTKSYKPVASSSKPAAPIISPDQIRLNEIENNLRKLKIIQEEPELTVEEIIQEGSKRRLKAEQDQFDRTFGTGGIAQLKRPL